jgi:tetratricopeptide (TPR) repeat protein
MKILFFILGSIQSRIVDWGIDNMQELLEEDIIFFGPIEENEFNLLNRKYDIISFDEVTPIGVVFSKLPINWIPDIVVCDVSTLNFIPDIYACPVKTYLLGRDGWGDISFNKQLCEFFDFLNYGIIDRNEFSKYNTHILPLISMPVSVPEKKSKIPHFEDRKIDVITIASYNDSFYHERFKTMYLFSNKSRNKLNVKYYKGLKRNEIHSYYRKSKIVLDWAHTLSNRSYEAAHNGCLVFSHEDNVLMKEFWEPFVEYVPYNNDNLNDLVDYYLSHIEESETIISNMRRKFASIPKTFGGSIMYHLKIAMNTEIDVSERINRINMLDKSIFYHRISTGFYFYYFYKIADLQKQWSTEYFSRISKAFENHRNINLQITPLIEAARFAFLLKDYTNTLKYCSKLQEIFPEYPWTYYILSRVSYESGNFDAALNQINEAINNFRLFPKLLDQYPLPFSEHKNSCDGRRVVGYLWRSIKNSHALSQAQAFQIMSYTLLGYIHTAKNETQKAIAAYKTAVKSAPIADTIIKLNKLLKKEKNYEKIAQYTELGLADAPYNTDLQLMRFISLLKTNNRKYAHSTFLKHRNTLKSFKNNIMIIVMRLKILFVYLFSF